MWKCSIIVAVLVILISVSSLCAAILLTRKKLKEYDTRVAEKLTIFILFLIILVYLAPIIAMSILIFYDFYVAIFIGCSMILSTIPVAFFIIIPLSNRMKIKYVEKIYGKDSDFANYMRKKHKKG